MFSKSNCGKATKTSGSGDFEFFENVYLFFRFFYKTKYDRWRVVVPNLISGSAM